MPKMTRKEGHEEFRRQKPTPTDRQKKKTVKIDAVQK